VKETSFFILNLKLNTYDYRLSCNQSPDITCTPCRRQLQSLLDNYLSIFVRTVKLNGKILILGSRKAVTFLIDKTKLVKLIVKN